MPQRHRQHLKEIAIPNLSEIINKVKEGSMQFIFDNESKKWKCTSSQDNNNNEFHDSDGIIKLIIILMGELAFLAIIFGKDKGFSLPWCYWCDLIKAHWQMNDHIMQCMDLQLVVYCVSKHKH